MRSDVSLSRKHRWCKQVANGTRGHSYLFRRGDAFLVFVSFVVIYDYAYQFLFSRFESSKKTGKLIVFFVAQLAFWVVVFFLWFDIRKQMGL